MDVLTLGSLVDGRNERNSGCYKQGKVLPARGCDSELYCEQPTPIHIISCSLSLIWRSRVRFLAAAIFRINFVIRSLNLSTFQICHTRNLFRFRQHCSYRNNYNCTLLYSLTHSFSFAEEPVRHQCTPTKDSLLLSRCSRR